jgi:prepilin-type N-terminal cleavage/methylation domain-containing protein
MQLRHEDNGPLRATSRQGFTLLELLVVIVIIGVLAAVLLGAYQQARTAAWKMKARDAARQLATAWNAYLIQGGSFPTNLVAETTYNTDAPRSLTFETTTNNMTVLNQFNAGRGLLEQSADQRLNGMKDHWGRYFHVRLDVNYDGMISSPLDNTPIRANVVAWSLGPNPNIRTNSWVIVWPE